MFNIYFVTDSYLSITNGPKRFADYFIQLAMTKVRDVRLNVIATDQRSSKYGEKVIYIPRKPSHGATLITAFKINRFLRDEIKKRRVDIVYYNFPDYAFLGLGRDKVKTFVNFNDYCNASTSIKDLTDVRKNTSLRRYIRKPFERRACELNDIILVNSCYLRNKLVESYKLNKNKIFVTYKAVDISKLNNNCSKDLSKEIRLIFIGTDYKTKGFFVVLNVVKKLISEYHIQTSLKVLGSSPKALREIKKLARENGLYEYLRIFDGTTGIKTEDLLKDSDILLLPSIREALGVAVIEAMAAGVVPIASHVGGIPELIDHGKNGYLIEPGDEEAICQHILELRTDKDEFRQMQQNGRTKSMKYSVDNIMGGILNLLYK